MIARVLLRTHPFELVLHRSVQPLFCFWGLERAASSEQAGDKDRLPHQLE
jgi:hypothetical protein